MLQIAHIARIARVAAVAGGVLAAPLGALALTDSVAMADNGTENSTFSGTVDNPSAGVASRTADQASSTSTSGVNRGPGDLKSSPSTHTERKNGEGGVFITVVGILDEDPKVYIAETKPGNN